MTIKRRRAGVGIVTVPAPDPNISEVKCCVCKNFITKQGWCESCNQYPINITPIRDCPDCGGRVDTGGLCMKCQACTRTYLEPQAAYWRDTGRVAKLLSREENHQRWTDLVRIMDSQDASGATIAVALAMHEREPELGWDKAAKDIEEYRKRERDLRVTRKQHRRDTRKMVD